jgi:hypothetical protein
MWRQYRRPAGGIRMLSGNRLLLATRSLAREHKKSFENYFNQMKQLQDSQLASEKSSQRGSDALNVTTAALDSANTHANGHKEKTAEPVADYNETPYATRPPGAGEDGHARLTKKAEFHGE